MMRRKIPDRGHRRSTNSEWCFCLGIPTRNARNIFDTTVLEDNLACQAGADLAQQNVEAWHGVEARSLRLEKTDGQNTGFYHRKLPRKSPGIKSCGCRTAEALQHMNSRTWRQGSEWTPSWALVHMFPLRYPRRRERCWITGRVIHTRAVERCHVGYSPVPSGSLPRAGSRCELGFDRRAPGAVRVQCDLGRSQLT